VITPSAEAARLFSKVVVVSVLIVFLMPIFSSQILVAGPKTQAKPYALIVGTVWGPDDRPVYGVSVKIRRAKDKKAKWELRSDHMGEFAQRVPAGESDYVVWADLKGFKLENGKVLKAVQDVKVHIYREERADIGLHLTY
jgi:hypothetical protein